MTPIKGHKKNVVSILCEADDRKSDGNNNFR